jgi:alcohol dehydrogenase (cytochrome c)
MLVLLTVSGAMAQQPDPATAGANAFAARCAVCHGGDGNGSDRAPSLLAFVSAQPDPQIAMLIRSGRGGMPAHQIDDSEMNALLGFLHMLHPVTTEAPLHRVVNLAEGGTIAGRVLNETRFDLQMAGDDGRLHLLSRDGVKYREPAIQPAEDWPRYDGSFTSNRHSPLDQIDATNVQRLALQWMFPVPGAPRLEATPVVVQGVMYVTAVNAAFALDARSGRQLWSYKRPRTPGLLGEAAGGANRGVGVATDRVLMLTDNAHLIALDKRDGALLWDVAMTDWPQSQYSASGAPLVIGDSVIAGVAGGEEGVRGFLASYDLRTGKRNWRFWTIPSRGEKLAQTWKGSALEHGCGATWMSGSYDPELDLLYWAVGNPCPDFDGTERQGDNLYTNSVLALRPKTGELLWHFQFTPHDTHDYDAAEPLVLVDASWRGRPRRLLIQADRNGFFFVLDRTNGTLLHATPFVTVTWASGYGRDGRPILLPNNEPTPAGQPICPGAGTNWMSAAFDPALRLFYVSATDRCTVTKRVSAPFEMGKRYFGGTGSMATVGTHALRALDLETGNTAWEYEQVGAGRSASGALSTAGGVVFIGEDSGVFTALDAKSGRPLWHFFANDTFRASPMTYSVAGRQYVCIADAAGFLSFALPD